MDDLVPASSSSQISMLNTSNISPISKSSCSKRRRVTFLHDGGNDNDTDNSGQDMKDGDDQGINDEDVMSQVDTVEPAQVVGQVAVKIPEPPNAPLMMPVTTAPQTPLSQQFDQWKFLDPSFEPRSFILPYYVRYFLEGKLKSEHVTIFDVIRFFARRMPENDYGFIIPSLFLLEFCLKKMGSLQILLEFYNDTKTDQLHLEFRSLITSIVIYQLQRQIKKITRALNVPDELNSILNYDLVFEEMRDGYQHDTSELSTVLLALIKQMEAVLIGIIHREEDDNTRKLRNNNIQLSDKMFGVAVIKSIMESIKTKTFRNVYESMMLCAVEMNVGNPQTCLRTINAFGILRNIKIHRYNAIQHRIPYDNLVRAVPQHKFVHSNISSGSGIEVNVLLDLIYTKKSVPHYDGLMSFAVYKMAKGLGIPDVMKFLFGSNGPLCYTLIRGSRIDIMKICVKERNEEIFKALPNLNLWLRQEDKSNMLSGLNRLDVVWFLSNKNRPKIPFNTEYELYCTLVNWALAYNGEPETIPARFKAASQNVDVCKSFQMVFEDSLCLLDLQDFELKKMFEHCFIGQDVIKSALDMLSNRIKASTKPYLRRREDLNDTTYNMQY